MELIKCPMCLEGNMHIILDRPGWLKCDKCEDDLPLHFLDKYDSVRLVKVGSGNWVKCPRYKFKEIWWGKCVSCDYCNGMAGYSVFKCNYEV